MTAQINRRGGGLRGGRGFGFLPFGYPTPIQPSLVPLSPGGGGGGEVKREASLEGPDSPNLAANFAAQPVPARQARRGGRSASLHPPPCSPPSAPHRRMAA